MVSGQPPLGAPGQDSFATLTEVGLEQMDALWPTLEPGSYTDCSGYDGCITRIPLRDDELEWCWGLDPPAAEVEAPAAFVSALGAAFWDCEASEIVTVDDGCEGIEP